MHLYAKYSIPFVVGDVNQSKMTIANIIKPHSAPIVQHRVHINLYE